MSDTVSDVQPGPWARRAAANVRAELARHDLRASWLAEQIGMHPQTLSQRLKSEGTMSLDVEEVGRIAEAIAQRAGQPTAEVAARLWP
jgi:AraC-like DNA-binding protein